jgi:hypothetical protein
VEGPRHGEEAEGDRRADPRRRRRKTPFWPGNHGQMLARRPEGEDSAPS